MTRTTFATLVALLTGFLSPWASADDLASVARGGRLYDNWSLESKGRAPNHVNPVLKINSARRTAPDTWRCVT